MIAGLLLSILPAACKGPAPTASPQAVSVPQPAPRPPEVVWRRSDIPRIDMHDHIDLGAGIPAVRLMAPYGIVHLVNLSGPPPDRGLVEFVVDSQVAYNRITVFTNLNWSYCQHPGYGSRMAADLVRAKGMGARGVKIPKGLGLGFEGPAGKLLAIDDPGLDPVFQKAGELGMPVAIHSGDPKAFWEEPGPNNERSDELSAHPGWSFWEGSQKGEIPTWQQLFDAFARRVARHPKTIIIGVHFGNDPEDPAQVGRLLDQNPNFMIDLAARIPAIGKRDAAHDPAAMRAFFVKYQDRILFGTDTGVGRRPQDFMFGSTGKDPPTRADADRFFDSIWRYLETDQKDIPTPTPIQGRWNVDGIALPREVLEKIYYKNAQRLLGIKLPEGPLPIQE